MDEYDDVQDFEDDCENRDYDYPDGDHDETNYDPYAGCDTYEVEPLDGWD